MLALLLAAGFAGCGSDADEGGIEVRVTITRDFGSRQLDARIAQNVPSSETAMQLLRRSFDVEARDDGSLYVNGVERDVSAADVQLHDGDRIWWDRHDLGGAPHVAAVVGAFPEPFAHGAEGKRYPIVLECADEAEEACETVSRRLAAVDVNAARQTLGTGVGERTVRVLVGRWIDLRADHALAQIDRGPAESGVFAHFPDLGRAPYDGRALELFDANGDPISEIHEGAGLVVATRFEEQAPTWAITGTDAVGVMAAARALDERTLRNRFAIAIAAEGSDETVYPLPTTQ